MSARFLNNPVISSFCTAISLKLSISAIEIQKSLCL